MMAKRSAHDELKREGEARSRRLSEIARERDTWDGRLKNADTRMAELAERRETSEAELETAQTVPGKIADERASLADPKRLYNDFIRTEELSLLN